MNLFICLMGVMLCEASAQVQSKRKIPSYPNDLFQIQPEDENCGDPGEPLILTPLIRSGNIQEARDLARVVGLTKVTSYSGFFTVKKKFNANMFFWFFPASANKKYAPLLIWLEGGPGTSSLLGLFLINGPFYVDSNIRIQLRKKYAWSLTHSIIYFDNPVGTGFSFTDDGGYVKNQEEVGQDLYEALQQFFTLFPEYQSRDLYVTGESYAGKYGPAVTYKIHMENQKSPKIKINLKGMAIGNPWLDPENQVDYGDFLYSIGLVDQNQRLYFQKEEEKTKALIKESKWMEAYNVLDPIIGLQVLTSVGNYFRQVSGFNFELNFLYDNDPYPKYWPKFLEKNCTRQEIHVGNTEFTGALLFSPNVHRNLREDMSKSMRPWMEALLDAKESYRILIYAGNLDISCGHPLVDQMIRKFKWNGADEFRKADRNIWRLDGDLVGYVKKVKNFTQIMIRNAGHLVPTDKPKVAFEMINRFTSGQPLA